jgi:hypothetical protein
VPTRIYSSLFILFPLQKINEVQISLLLGSYGGAAGLLKDAADLTGSPYLPLCTLCMQQII